MTIDDYAAIRLLQELPHDLRQRGWGFDQRESSVQHLPGSLWCDAVYTRSFEAGIDADVLAQVVRGQQVVRVSTIRARNRSWQAARDEAVDLMRAVDAQRQIPGSKP